MIICIAAENDTVSPHFGHCTEFALYEVQGSEVRQIRVEPNPGHSPGTLPPLLREWGVTHVIAGGIGQRAISLFRSMGIEVVSGAQGKPEEAARSLATGELEAGGNVCDHSKGHGHGHGGGKHG